MIRPTALVFALFAAGCGGAAGLAPVRGVVKYPDGSPAAALAGGEVVFEGKADGKAVSATGTIGKDGRFELSSLNPGDGAAVGPNRALVTAPPGEADGKSVSGVDAKYESFDTSGLTFDVKPGPNDFTVTVEPPAKRK